MKQVIEYISGHAKPFDRMSSQGKPAEIHKNFTTRA
jgi:hypothetical protein